MRKTATHSRSACALRNISAADAASLRFFLCKASLTLCLLMTSGAVYADSDLQFSGFGTLGLSWEDENDLAFVRDTGQSKDPDRDVSFLPDSVFGFQASYAFDQEWRATAQIVVRDYAEMDLDAATELAFIGYRPNPDIDLRLGRVPLDMFMMSDFRRVDYVNLWVRPPTELYSWILPTSIDGGDIAKNFLSGDYFWRAKLQFGSTEPVLELPDGSMQIEPEFNQFVVGTLAVDVHSWKGRVSLAQFETADSSPGFLPALSGIAQIPGPLGQEAALLAARLSTVSEEKVNYYQLGISYDDGSWIVDAEFAGLSSDTSTVPEGNAGYVSVGRRFDTFTPYLVYSKFFPEDEPFESTADWSIFPGAEGLRDAALGLINGTLIDQQTISVGLRWDFTTKAALKIQWDRTDVEKNAYALWAYSGGRNEDDSQVDLLTVSFNFIF